MGRQIIQLVQVLVDRLEDAAARQQKHWQYWEEEGEKRKAAEKDRDHWQQAWKDAHEAGELMRAEILHLREQLAEAQQQGVDAMRSDVGALRAKGERLANLVRFVEHVREFLSKNNSYITYADINGVRNALRLLDCQNPKVAETAEGGT